MNQSLGHGAFTTPPSYDKTWPKSHLCYNTTLEAFLLPFKANAMQIKMELKNLLLSKGLSLTGPTVAVHKKELSHGCMGVRHIKYLAFNSASLQACSACTSDLPLAPVTSRLPLPTHLPPLSLPCSKPHLVLNSSCKWEWAP